MPKRKPRLSFAIRSRIVQLRASNPEHPPSLDTILSRLVDEGWDRIPSRGSVQNLVHWWESLDPDIRARELPFRWQQLDRARIPWEAAEWVLSCWHRFDSQKLQGIPESVTKTTTSEAIKPFLRAWGPFTNRWATWCWRVHLAAPDLPEFVVIALASEYGLAEASADLGFTPAIGLQGIDAFLRCGPWRSIERAEEYETACEHGLVPAIPEFDYEAAVESNISTAYYNLDIGSPFREGAREEPVSQIGPLLAGILAFYWRQWYRHILYLGRMEAGNARNTEATEQGQLDDYL